MKDDASRRDKTKSSRWPAVFGDVLLTGFAVVLTTASFAADEGAAYLFPRILSLTMLMFCLLQLIILPFGAKQAAIAWRWRSLPAVGVIVVYVAIAEWLGFYAATAVTFFAIVQIGDSVRTKRQRVVAVIVAICATAVLYGLFSLLLQVQIPRGLLF